MRFLESPAHVSYAAGPANSNRCGHRNTRPRWHFTAYPKLSTLLSPLPLGKRLQLSGSGFLKFTYEFE